MANRQTSAHKDSADAPSFGSGRLPAGSTRRIGAKDDRIKANKQFNVTVVQADIDWIKAAHAAHGAGVGLGKFAFALMREGLEARTQPARVQVSEKAASAGDLARVEDALQERLAHLDEALTIALQQNKHLHDAVRAAAGQVEGLANQVGLNTRSLIELRPAIGSGGSRYPKKTN